MLAEKPESLQLLDRLKVISNLLDAEQDKKLLVDIQSLDNYLSNHSFKVSVFGSFNHGKSTLLNALLGNKILPAELIPTTGAAINIKYGTELRTRIIFSDGKEINEKGTEVLQCFTRLDGERQMRSDLSSVEVFIPHPFLQNGIELVDLPGTNDREEQNNLVCQQLLSADLIIQVLDANQLFTLTEVENLQYWLIERGIETVVFVVNFLNLLEVEDQIKVMQRARFLAEEFRGNFPDGISNLYRVDALPALKAKHKGELETAFRSGILNFESAVQNIVAVLSNDIHRYRLPRVLKIADQVKQSLQAQVQTLETDLEILIGNHNSQLQQDRQKLGRLKIIFQGIINNFANWLSTKNLLTRYQDNLTIAIQNNSFKTWKQDFNKALDERLEVLKKCVDKTSDICPKSKPKNFSILLPSEPNIIHPKAPETENPRTKRSVAIATGIGWFILGPVGGAIAAGATHVANENYKQQQQELWTKYYFDLKLAYTKAAEKYLKKVSVRGLSQLKAYQEEVENMFSLTTTDEPVEIINKRSQLNQLNIALEQLNVELQNI